jgi:signal transduction histidine kinase
VVAKETGIGPMRSWFATAAIAVSVLLGVFTAFLAQTSLTQLNAMADARLSDSDRRLHLVELLSLLKDLETGQRGFVITGKESYLKPYQTALRDLPAAIAKVKPTDGSAWALQFDWGQFEALIALRQQFAERAISERRSLGVAVLLNSPLFGQGKAAMDQIRASVETLNAMQIQHIASLSAAMEDMRRKAFLRELLSSLATGVLVTLATGIWLFERRRRMQLYGDLQRANATLEQRVQERTQALRAAGEQIREFAAQMDHNIEAERRRMAREVHDQIGQVFTVIKMIFRSMQPHSLAPDQESALAAAIDSGVSTTRRIAAELRPPLLDDLGLAAALDHYLKGLVRSTGLTASVRVSDADKLSGQQGMQLFRIVQEATTNVLRHAKASHLAVAGGLQGTQFLLTIEDNGIGFDLSAVRAGTMGLLGIRERAALIGGQAVSEMRSQGGTRIRVSFPFQPGLAA